MQKIPLNLIRIFFPKSQLISLCENVTNLARGEVSWPENFQMFFWPSSAISKIQKWLVYKVAKLFLSVLYTSLALINTILADIRQNCTQGIAVRQRDHSFLQNFSISFLKQTTVRWFLAPALSTSSQEVRTLLMLHRFELCGSHTDLWITSCHQWSDSHWICWPLGQDPGANNFSSRKISVGLAFLLTVTGSDGNCGWFLEEWKEMSPVV